MTVDSYRATVEGQHIDLDGYPQSQPYQCVDLANDYSLRVAAGQRFTGNAKDIYGQQPEHYDWVRNTPSGVPPKGSVFVYGAPWGGGYGHVGIVLAADVNTVTLLEQNDPFPRVTVGTHNYNGCIGWGIPKVNVNPVVSGGGRYQAINTAMVRIAPHVSAPLGGSQKLVVGEWFDASGTVVGDMVNGNAIWVRSLKGNYVWSGNLKRIG